MKFESLRWGWPAARQQCSRRGRLGGGRGRFIALLLIQPAPHCKLQSLALAAWECLMGKMVRLVKTLIIGNNGQLTCGQLACNACENSCLGNLRKQGHHFAKLYTSHCCMMMLDYWNAATVLTQCKLVVHCVHENFAKLLAKYCVGLGDNVYNADKAKAQDLLKCSMIYC